MEDSHMLFYQLYYCEYYADKSSNYTFFKVQKHAFYNPIYKRESLIRGLNLTQINWINFSWDYYFSLYIIVNWIDFFILFALKNY